MGSTAEQKAKHTKVAFGVIAGVFVVGVVVLLVHLATRDLTVPVTAGVPVKYSHSGGGGGAGSGQHGVDGKHYWSKSKGWKPDGSSTKIKAEDGKDHFIEKHGRTALTQAKRACAAADTCHAVSEDHTGKKAYAWAALSGVEDGNHSIALVAGTDGHVAKDVSAGEVVTKVFFHNPAITTQKPVGTVIKEYSGATELTVQQAKADCAENYKVCQAVVVETDKTTTTMSDITAFVTVTLEDGETKTYYNDKVDHLVPLSDLVASVNPTGATPIHVGTAFTLESAKLACQADIDCDVVLYSTDKSTVSLWSNATTFMADTDHIQNMFCKPHVHPAAIAAATPAPAPVVGEAPGAETAFIKPITNSNKIGTTNLYLNLQAALDACKENEECDLVLSTYGDEASASLWGGSTADNPVTFETDSTQRVFCKTSVQGFANTAANVASTTIGAAIGGVTIVTDSATQLYATTTYATHDEALQACLDDTDCDCVLTSSVVTTTNDATLWSNVDTFKTETTQQVYCKLLPGLQAIAAA